MDQPTQSPQAITQAYVRRRHLEVEPAVFALALIAVVTSISLCKPVPPVEQIAPAEAPRTVAQAPSR